MNSFYMETVYFSFLPPCNLHTRHVTTQLRNDAFFQNKVYQNACLGSMDYSRLGLFGYANTSFTYWLITCAVLYSAQRAFKSE